MLEKSVDILSFLVFALIIIFLFQKNNVNILLKKLID